MNIKVLINVKKNCRNLDSNWSSLTLTNKVSLLLPKIGMIVIDSKREKDMKYVPEPDETGYIGHV